MKKIITITCILLTAMFLFPGTATAKDKYTNTRFGFTLDLPDKWSSYRDPAPANGDGVSFSLPGEARFSASGSYNALERSLDESIKEWTDEKKLLRNTPIELSGGKGRYIRWNDQGKGHMLLLILSGIRGLILPYITGRRKRHTHFTAPKRLKALKVLKY